MKRHAAILGAAALLTLLPVTALAQTQDVVEYVVLDGLGNVRVVEDEKGNVVERHDYLAFGEECTTGKCASNPGIDRGQPLRFTGKERDPETGLDYFGARYYGSRIGRFTTVDPGLNLKASLFNPQRWNRYSYSLNNPLRFNDPDGREVPVMVDNKLYNMGLEGPPPMTRRDAAIALGVYGAAFGLAYVPAVAPILPAMWAEVQIAVGTCLPSAACQNAVRGGIEAASGAPPGAMGALPTFAPGKLLPHFEKHGAEFGFRTAEEYLQAAQKLTQGGEGIGTFVRGNGDRLFYDATKNAFGATSGEGVIKTFFKPLEGAEYWGRQISQ